MTGMEIALLICGAAIFIISFFLPEGRSGEGGGSIDKKAISEAVEEEVSAARDRISDAVDETVRYAVERAEGSMDRVTNEKIMALSEYSESVMTGIDKNHQEVLFLYDMLNEKSVDLKNTVREAQHVQKETAEVIKESAEVIKESEEVIREEAPAPAPEPEEFTPIVPLPIEPEESALPNRPMSAIERLAMASAAADARIDRAQQEAARKKKAPAKRTVRANANIDMALDEARTPGRNKNDMILQLHRQGKSNVEVARELGLGMGEVKLVIDLFEGIK